MFSGRGASWGPDRLGWFHRGHGWPHTLPDSNVNRASWPLMWGRLFALTDTLMFLNSSLSLSQQTVLLLLFVSRRHKETLHNASSEAASLFQKAWQETCLSLFRWLKHERPFLFSETEQSVSGVKKKNVLILRSAETAPECSAGTSRAPGWIFYKFELLLFVLLVFAFRFWVKSRVWAEFKLCAKRRSSVYITQILFWAFSLCKTPDPAHVCLLAKYSMNHWMDFNHHWTYS